MALLLIAACLSGCTREARVIGPSAPHTPPLGDADPRIPAYQNNAYQLAQGGRYFAWYGCQGCHADPAPGVLDLPDAKWRYGGGFAQVYAAIADRHGALAFGKRIPSEVLWQLTAFVRDLPEHTYDKRRRQNLDQQAEPVGPGWSGPQ